MRALIPALVLIVASFASAQSATTLRGFVHRELTWGCGQMWSSHVARSDVTLSIVGSQATLHVDAHVVDASGGVDDATGPHHDETTRAITIDWRGRVRRAHGAMVIALSALTESVPAAGSPIAITNRTTEPARITCTRAMHDVMQASRPRSLAGEPAIARRPITTCTFEPVAHEGALPRPVADVLSTPFFLDDGAGITTDAIYRGGLGATPDALVARAPGWVDP